MYPDDKRPAERFWHRGPETVTAGANVNSPVFVCTDVDVEINASGVLQPATDEGLIQVRGPAFDWVCNVPGTVASTQIEVQFSQLPDMSDPITIAIPAAAAGVYSSNLAHASGSPSSPVVQPLSSPAPFFRVRFNNGGGGPQTDDWQLMVRAGGWR